MKNSQFSISFSILLHHRRIIILLVQIAQQKNSYVKPIQKNQMINQIKKDLQVEQRTPTFLFLFLFQVKDRKKELLR